MIHFTSDTFFYSKFAANKRGFGDDVEAMNQSLIDTWNSKVKPDDHVYHLGNFFKRSGDNVDAEEIIPQLNGYIWLTPSYYDERGLIAFGHWDVEWQLAVLIVEHEGHEIHLSHYPLRRWHNQQKGTWHLYGGTFQKDFEQFDKSFDVGFDLWNGPIDFNNIVTQMRTR